MGYMRIREITRDLQASLPFVGMGGKKRKLIEIDVSAENTANDTEINAPDSVLNGTAAAIKFKIKSDDAGDTDEPVHVIYIDDSGDLVTETVTTDGTDGTTAVSSTGDVIRILHAYLDTAMTGNLLVRNAADNATYLTITAAALDSNNVKVWVPTGWDARVGKVIINHTTNASKGTLFRVKATGFDEPNRIAPIMGNILTQRELDPVVIGTNSDDGAIEFTEQRVDAADSYNLRAFVLLTEMI